MLTGSLQSAVGSKPLYNYTIDAKYAFAPPTAVQYSFAAAFKALASQQTNADPDGMKLAAAFRFDQPLPRRNGMIITSDLIAYEFSRTLKADKPLDLNQAPPQFIERNSNRVHTAYVTFVRSERFGGLKFRPIGIEIGKALTRTVKTDSSGKTETSVLRGVFGADYYNFWSPASGFKRVDFEVQHTQRLLHSPEPYKRPAPTVGNNTSAAMHVRLQQRD